MASNTKVRLGVVALMAASVVAIGGVRHDSSPAQAACVSGQVFYELLSPTQHYLLGPKACLVPTPWAECNQLTVAPGSEGFVYVRADVWITCPAALAPPT